MVSSEKTVNVSVIIPTYNRAEALRRCLDSLINQTYNDFEVLVCDDGSTDDSEKVTNEFISSLTITYLWNENFGGPAKPRNAGIASASGKYLAFLDSDDWWVPEKLEKSVQALEAGADFIYHDLYIMPFGADKSRFWKRSKTRQVKGSVFADLLLQGNEINNSSVVVRRDLMEQIGGFSEDKKLIAAEDYDAWLRVAKLTNSFVRLRGCLGYYAISKDNFSSADRTIIKLHRLVELYGTEISETDLKGSSINYLLAKAYYGCGNYSEARVKALEVVFSSSSPYVTVKASFLLLISALLRMIE